jgi:hypothetical protein
LVPGQPGELAQRPRHSDYLDFEARGQRSSRSHQRPVARHGGRPRPCIARGVRRFCTSGRSRASAGWRSRRASSITTTVTRLPPPISSVILSESPASSRHLLL